MKQTTLNKPTSSGFEVQNLFGFKVSNPNQNLIFFKSSIKFLIRMMKKIYLCLLIKVKYKIIKIIIANKTIANETVTKSDIFVLIDLLLLNQILLP